MILPFRTAIGFSLSCPAHQQSGHRRGVAIYLEGAVKAAGGRHSCGHVGKQWNESDLVFDEMRNGGKRSRYRRSFTFEVPGIFVDVPEARRTDHLSKELQD